MPIASPSSWTLKCTHVFNHMLLIPCFSAAVDDRLMRSRDLAKSIYRRKELRVMTEVCAGALQRSGRGPYTRVSKRRSSGKMPEKK